MARPTHCELVQLSTPELPICNLSALDSTLLAGPQRVHLILGGMNLTTESPSTAPDLLHCLPTLPRSQLRPLSPSAPSTCSRGNPAAVPTSYGLIFHDEGFIIGRCPLKLHMTLMNSTYRRPRTKRPQAFDYNAILRQAGVLECFSVLESEYAEISLVVPMGSYDVPRVHLCKMGSWNTDGAYVSCGDTPSSKELVQAITILCRIIFGISLGIPVILHHLTLLSHRAVQRHPYILGPMGWSFS
ncbi:hypothetical protein EDD18DRAFT_1461249 [Armillaria luteobubalina]|uniref:Uncharacterized protein n=1 Tax=Armillaria luteobubalina TaxID=153913 RepID=A0AA39Q8E1_9AGAR|nr:hypothetical protein EDD18DRAFT_1461249 [Armillaria luteobubalina]